MLLPFLAVALPGTSPAQVAQGPAPAPPAVAAYDDALKLLQTGKPAEALARIDAALVKNPSNSGLYNLRGLAASQLGREDEAERSFRKLIELSPQAALGYNNLAILLSHRGRQEEAAALFRAALDRRPQDFTALLGLGATLAALQRYAEARPYLEKAWNAKPRDFQAGYEYAHALRELQRPAEARKVLEQLSPPGDAAAAAKFFVLSGVVAEDQKDRAAAARFYSQAFRLNPESFEVYASLARAALENNSQGFTLPPAPRHLSAEQHFALGLLFASRAAYATAIPHFEATLRMEPSSYSAAFNLALSYQGAGKNQAAVELCEATLRKKPTAELYNLLGSLDEDTGRYLEAVGNYQKAVELEPTSERYYFDLGMEYLRHFTFGPALDVFRLGTGRFPGALRQQVGMGFAYYAQRRYSEAAQAFLAALEIDPSSPTAFKAWVSLPDFLAPAEWKSILPRLERLAGRHPGSAEALYYYGASLFRLQLASGDRTSLDLAQSLLERSLSLKPDFPEASLELGSSYAAQGKAEKAVPQFLEAIRLSPNSEMAHYRLGQTYRDLNKLDLAQAELARYQDLVRRRHEERARSRSAIKQFILTEAGKRESSGDAGRERLPN